MSQDTSTWNTNIKLATTTWWHGKTIEEKTDLESSFVIVINSIGMAVPMLLFTLV
ncbi:hypothetical protein [Psychrobium sp. 1_MG-2023]|uniref:hypothetical protein n=1 Tax=Psychrobium sp. 1_MG-2023 TaxID=3062624 RepID=UPI0027358962|nr:hypothetical protein [Psychrobium sp. 1_MG-2023]MDP2560498.1 hypothetical protein [Psychrobium sp. 1_MG-2023]